MIRTLCLFLTMSLVVSMSEAWADQSRIKASGWQPAKLEAVREFVSSLSTDALLIVTGGETVLAHGALDRPYNVHSIRKAFLSALVGQHVGDGPGRIQLGATLEQLGIDDGPITLTRGQKQATVLHLIRSVSGINHPAAAEGGLTRDKNRRLGKKENVPGTVWAYNNWDYNALTTVFEDRTGLTVAEAFKSGIADRIGLRDFSVDHVSYAAEPRLSQHRAAMFVMSARDLAKVGALYLSRGTWQGNQIIASAWVDRITGDHTATGIKGLRAGHGYLWWIPGPETGLPEGTYWASGLGQQALFVIPAWRTVVVHQSDTTEFIRRFLKMVRIDGIPGNTAIEQLALHCLEPANAGSDYCRNDRFILTREFAKLISLIIDARAAQ